MPHGQGHLLYQLLICYQYQQRDAFLRHSVDTDAGALGLEPAPRPAGGWSQGGERARREDGRSGGGPQVPPGHGATGLSAPTPPSLASQNPKWPPTTPTPRGRRPRSCRPRRAGARAASASWRSRAARPAWRRPRAAAAAARSSWGLGPERAWQSSFPSSTPISATTWPRSDCPSRGSTVGSSQRAPATRGSPSLCSWGAGHAVCSRLPSLRVSSHREATGGLFLQAHTGEGIAGCLFQKLPGHWVRPKPAPSACVPWRPDPATLGDPAVQSSGDRLCAQRSLGRPCRVALPPGPAALWAYKLCLDLSPLGHHRRPL